MEQTHHLIDITSLVCVVLFMGTLTAWIRQPPLVGFMVAGMIAGPQVLGLIDDREQIGLLAELGVLMLLFAVGTHMSLRGFKAVWPVALITTLIQIAASIIVMLVLSGIFDWSLPTTVLAGFVLSLSSTAVGVRMLENIGELRNQTGQIVVGILIAQDLMIAPMLITVNGLASGEGLGWSVLLRVLCAFALIAAIIWLLSRRQKLHVFLHRTISDWPELTPILGLALCLFFALATAELGLSAGLGAFLAGLYVGNTCERKVMLQAVDPIQTLLLMFFFVSVGLLFDIQFLVENYVSVILLVACVLIFNSMVNLFALRILGVPWSVAGLAGFAIAQIGEFSFLLTATGERLGLFDRDMVQLIVSVIALSLMISPVWLHLARSLHVIRAYAPESVNALLSAFMRKEKRILRLRSVRMLQLIVKTPGRLTWSLVHFMKAGSQMITDGLRVLHNYVSRSHRY